MEDPGIFSPSCTPLPSEWRPTQWDVAEANKVPDREIVQSFKSALLQSPDAQHLKQLLPPTNEASPGLCYLRSRQDVPPSSQLTYPLSTLPDLAHTPGWDDTVVQLQRPFSDTFKHHVYLDKLYLPNPAQKDIPFSAPLKYAQACISSMLREGENIEGEHIASSAHDLSVKLFELAVRLWIVTVEMDNRESRNNETLLASSLLATFGLLSPTPATWDVVRALMAYGTTILRRLHLNPKLGQDFGTSKSLIVYYTFMVDVLCAAHFHTLPNLSTKELNLKLPVSKYQFQEAYRRLFNNLEPLPPDIHAREDALSLLLGLLCDIIYIQRNDLSHQMRSSIEPSRSALVNPFTPLSRSRERSRQQTLLTSALNCWHQQHAHATDRNTLALFWYCRLLLSCPDLALLFSMAGYPPVPGGGGVLSQDPVPTSNSTATQVSVPEDAVKYAWKVLDHVDASKTLPNSQLPIWLPLTLFSAALVVWYSLRSHSSDSTQYGSFKVLGTFVHELNLLPWPCCEVMALVLERLVRDGTA